MQMRRTLKYDLTDRQQDAVGWDDIYMSYYRISVAELLLMSLIIGFLLIVNLSLVLPILLR